MAPDERLCARGVGEPHAHHTVRAAWGGAGDGGGSSETLRHGCREQQRRHHGCSPRQQHRHDAHLLDVSCRNEEDQNSERCKMESAVMGDGDGDDDDARLGSASSCMSRFIMLNACASCASSKNVSWVRVG